MRRFIFLIIVQLQNVVNADYNFDNSWNNFNSKTTKSWNAFESQGPFKTIYKTKTQSLAIDYKKGLISIESKEKDVSSIYRGISSVDNNLFESKSAFEKLVSGLIPKTCENCSQQKLKLKLPSSNLQSRAKKYLKIIDEVGKGTNIPSELILAVIHTESYFNPNAISHAGALGLMQIIPRYAGKEVHNYLFGNDSNNKPAFYFEPRNNILVGATYLNLLINKHYSNIFNEASRLYLSIASYNWGPHNVKKIFKKPLNDYSPSEIKYILSARTPTETRAYLNKVLKRYKNYKSNSLLIARN